ncbi:1, 4-beta cellobiohydrolase [Umbelopsis sp. AD052]|nr:1, 4-beta cellobiohydrolase [Umbelopsis sp. AD052]
MKFTSLSLALALVAPSVLAQSCAPAWGQCGGTGWTGATCCQAGWTCVGQAGNPYYSQCLQSTGTTTTAATTTTSSKTTTSKTSTTTTNPITTTTATTTTAYAAGAFYAGKFYASEVQAFTAAGDTVNAAKAAKVENISTAVWLDSVAKIPSIATTLDDAVAVQKATGVTQVVTFVVYDLPNRDCAAAASNGEFSVADDGLTKYKGYVDSVAAAFAAYPTVRIVAVVEPDSLGNLVTNSGIAKCSEAADDYKQGIAYAIQKLQFNNVALYLDAAHAGWLGWPNNLQPAATLFAQVLGMANGGTIRGFATNVANYNAFKATTPDPVTQGSSTPDEASYIAALTPLLQKLNVPANFIVDTGRNGVQNIRAAWGDWCNVVGAGFGVRPTTNTGVANVDAFMWVKPGGEGDGTSNSTAPRYDFHCGQSDALQPAPQAGTWFNAYFQMLVKNANPSL